MNIQALPDKGEKLLKQIQALEDALSALALSPEQGMMGFALELSVCERVRHIPRKVEFIFSALLLASRRSPSDMCWCLSQRSCTLCSENS